MIHPENFRLSVGLLHSVSGAELTIVLKDGKELVAGTGPNADLHPCFLRKSELVSRVNGLTSCTGEIKKIHLGGTLQDVGGGVYQEQVEHGSQYWYATVASPETTNELLCSIASEHDDHNEVMAVVRPDSCLGVSCVVVFDPASSDLCREIAYESAARSLANDLVRSVAGENNQLRKSN